MSANAVNYLSLLGITIDQALIALFRYFGPELLHNEPYFPLIQSWPARFVLLLSLLILWNSKKIPKSALYLFTAGFLSNLITIVVYGKVLDYIPTGFSYINTADLLIVAGCIFFGRALLLRNRFDNSL